MRAVVEWRKLSDKQPPERTKCMFFFEVPNDKERGQRHFEKVVGHWTGAVIAKANRTTVQVPWPYRCYWAGLIELTPPEIRKYL